MRIKFLPLLCALVAIAASCSKSEPQPEAETPTLTVKQKEYAITSAANIVEVVVNANVPVTCEMPKDAEWIQEADTKAVTSNTFRFDVEENTGFGSRKAEIKFLNEENTLSATVKITQMQKNAIIVAQDAYEVGKDGTTISVLVGHNVDYDIEIDGEEWISLTDTKSFVEDEVSFIIAPNDTSEIREGSITFVASDKSVEQTITITQAPMEVIFTVSKESYDVAREGETISVEVGHNVNYSTSIDVDWITEDSSKSFMTDQLSFTVSENTTGARRTGSITFKTLDGAHSQTVKVVQSGPSTSVTDLSASGTANCYIVSGAGSYKFNATVKGGTSESVGTPASAEVLWESFGTSTALSVGDLVNTVSYADNYVAFNATSAKGNAVIAVKDASDAILWAWHIWLTDQPAEQVYKNTAGTMMDRNLGATSATPGDVKALGLFYQWGRKDPFLNGGGISSTTIAASTLASWPAAVASNATNGKMAFVNAHPTTFITANSKNYDWHYTGSKTVNDTRWTVSGTAKGKYDPCPVGWRVPDGGTAGIFAKGFGVTADFTSGPWDSTNMGMDFGSGNGKAATMQLGTAATIWFPATGYLTSAGGVISGVGANGRYWTATPSNLSGCGFTLDSTGAVSVTNTTGRASARSIRCVKE